MDTPTEDLLNFNEENEATEQGGFEDFVPVSAPEAEQKSAFNEEISSTTEPEKDVDDSNLVDTTEADTPVEDAGEEVMDEKEPESSPTPSCTSDSELTSFPARYMKDHGINEKVINLIYWKCWKKTAVVFGSKLFLLLSLTQFTLLSVVTFFSMALLTVALLYRIGMTVMGAIQKAGTENPFKKFLDKDIDISEDKAQEFAKCLVGHINKSSGNLRRLFLVEDIVDSVKFGVFLWVLSHVGCWFNALTLLIMFVVFVFSVPKLYEDHQDLVDKYAKMACSHAKDALAQVKEKLPARFKPKEKST